MIIGNTAIEAIKSRVDSYLCRIFRRFSYVIAAIFLLGGGVTGGCRGESKENSRRSLSRPGKSSAQRIVSLAPSTTEALFAIGAGKRVVGVSRYCNYPPEVKRLPKVGGFVDPSMEAILELKPDLVVGAQGPSGSKLVRQLEKMGIATWFVRVENTEDILNKLTSLGKLLGEKKNARGVVQNIKRQIAERKVNSLNPQRVLLIYSQKPISAAGPKSYGDELLKHAGVRNVLVQGPRYPSLGMESIHTLRPDVVIMAAHKGSTPNWLPQWKNKQLGNGNIQLRWLNDDRILRPGPRIVGAIDTLKKALAVSR